MSRLSAITAPTTAPTTSWRTISFLRSTYGAYRRVRSVPAGRRRVGQSRHGTGGDVGTGAADGSGDRTGMRDREGVRRGAGRRAVRVGGRGGGCQGRAGQRPPRRGARVR